MIVQKPEAEKRLDKKLKGRKIDWFLLSSAGTRKLGGPYGARSEAVGREKQVQYWKHQANPGNNPLRKIAEMHPDDRAIVGSAVGSVAGFLIAPPLAPIGAAAGHIAGKRLGRPKQNPGKGKQVFKEGDILITPWGELVIITGQTVKSGSRVKYEVAVDRGDYSPFAARHGIGTKTTYAVVDSSWEPEASKVLHKKFKEDPGEIYEPAWLAVANDLWGHANTPVNVITDGTVAPRYKTINVTVGGKKKKNPLFGRKKKEQAKKKPPKRKRHRSLRNIALDIKRNWKDLRHAGPENRRLLRIRGIVDTMQTLCHPSDIVEEGPSRGKSGDMLIGNFLATVGGAWKDGKDKNATRLKDELRAISAEQFWHDEPIENPDTSSGLRPGRPGAKERFPKVGDKIGDWKIVEANLGHAGAETIALERVVYGHTWTVEVAYFSAKVINRPYEGYTLYQNSRKELKRLVDANAMDIIDWKSDWNYERSPPQHGSASGYITAQGWQRLLRDAVDFSNKKIKKWVASQPPTRMLNPEKNPRRSAGLRPGRPGSKRLPPQDKEKIGDWEVIGTRDDEWEEFYRLRRVAYGETWTIDVGFKKKPTKKEYFHVFYTLSPGMITGPPKQEQDWKRVSPSGHMPPEGWQSLFREAVNFADDYIREWLAAPKDSSGRMRLKQRKKSNPISKNPEKNPRPFASRTHDWREVLIQKDGKRITRKQIFDYYWKNRKKIWPFLEGQTVLVVIAPKKNEFVLIRKRGSDEKYIKLTKLDGIDDERSFEYWINRRVVEFHPVLTGKKTPILWLDIDIHAKTKAKKTALRAVAKKAFPKLRKIMRQFGVAKIYAYDSGIGGYHLEGPLKAPKGVDKLRKDFTAALKAAFADDPIFTTGIAKPGQIRLDTTTMHRLGSLRAPFSFTVAGGTKKRI